MRAAEPLQEASAAVKTLEKDVVGIESGADDYIAQAEKMTVDAGEDLWCPTVQVPDGYVLDDTKGEIPPMPNHDGTECLQWDSTLWSCADHFRYRWSVYKGVRQAIGEVSVPTVLSRSARRFEALSGFPCPPPDALLGIRILHRGRRPRRRQGQGRQAISEQSAKPAMRHRCA